jgi:hypothetical protein
MQVIFGTVLVVLWIWIFLEIENAPFDRAGKMEYKDHITVFGIKVCKNFRKPKNK